MRSCRWGGVRRASGREMGSGAARVGGADPGARGGRTRGTLKRRTGCPGSAPRCAARPIPPHPRRPPPSALDFNPFKTKQITDLRLRPTLYSTSAEVQTFTCSDPQKTPKGTNFRKKILGSFSQTTPTSRKAFPSNMPRPCRMRGLQLVDRWISRPRDPFAGLPKCPRGAGQKEVSCAGLRGRVHGRGGAPGGGGRSSA